VDYTITNYRTAWTVNREPAMSIAWPALYVTVLGPLPFLRVITDRQFSPPEVDKPLARMDLFK
jgi:hypothetical protein